MAKYILFDKLCETHYNNTFINATKEIATLLGINLEKRNDFKSDLGLAGKARDILGFHRANAYSLSIASHDRQEIVCADDSSFLSLNLTKQALRKDENLSNEIKNSLGIELNIDAKITHFNELLLGKQEVLSTKITKPFSAFITTAYYGPHANRLSQFFDIASTSKLLETLQAKVIKSSTCKSPDGYEIKEINKKVAYHLAGTVLLDAFDNAADFLVTNDVTTMSIFDTYQKAIEKEMGRDFHLSIFTLNQLLLLACGITDKELLGFDELKTKVTLL